MAISYKNLIEHESIKTEIAEATSAIATQLGEQMASHADVITEQVKSSNAELVENINTTMGEHLHSNFIRNLVIAFIIITAVTVCSTISQLFITSTIVDQYEKIHTELQDIKETLNEHSSVLNRFSNVNNFVYDNTTDFIDHSVTPQVVELVNRNQPVPVPEPALEPVQVIDPNNLSLLTTPTGFTPEQFDAVIMETFTTKLTCEDIGIFENLGETLYQVEQENGFNALYILGIGGLESGYGTSSMARNQNNPYGMIGLSFDSVPDATLYLGNLLQKRYISQGRTSLTKIGQKYCPPTYEHWAGSVQWITNQYISTAQDMVREGRI